MMTIRQRLMKLMYPLIMRGGKNSKMHLIQEAPSDARSTDSFYSLHVQLNTGQDFSFESLRGKEVLLVNTASDCGFTGQYSGLQTLFEKKSDNVMVIGFPANDFKAQEQGKDADINTFCQVNYGVTFPLAKKASVIKGESQQAVFNWLSNAKHNGWCDQDPIWNFCKYHIDAQGQLKGVYGPAIEPSEIKLPG